MPCPDRADERSNPSSPLYSKLKIALFSYRGNPFCGGQGVYLRHLSRALAGRGHRVHVFTGPPYPGEMPWADVHLLPDENFIVRPARYFPARKMLDPFHLFEYGLARLGSNPEMLAQSLRLYLLLRRLHREEPFDVLHDNHSLGYGLLLVQRLGLPVVATIHHPLGIDRREDLRQMQGLLRRARRAIYYPLVMQGVVARRLDGVITVSDFAGQMVRDYYRLAPGEVERVYNGVDGAFFRPRAEIKKVPGRAIFVGSTEDRKKGVRYLLEALKVLEPPAHLVIVDGRRYPGRVYAQNLILELGLQSRVIWREQISDEELVQEYNLAEVAVVPSLFEGFGLPALEAMACGLPVVATTAGALPEVTGADGEAALLVPTREPEALARAIRRLLASPALRQRLGEQARRRAERNFSWDQAAAATEAVYLQVRRDRRAPY